MATTETLTGSRTYALSQRLWPEITVMDEFRQIAALESMVQLFYLSPFALAGIIWLLLRTDYAFLGAHLNSLAILFVTMVLLLLQPFSIRVRLGREEDELNITTSLAPLVMWSALFISGAAGLWALILAAAVAALWRGWQLASYGQNSLWSPLSFFIEQVGVYLFPTLVAASVYLALDGAFPVSGDTLADWLPALVTILVGALLSGLLLLPVAIQINSLSAAGNRLVDLIRFYAGAVSLPLLISPFAIIIALINAEGRTLALVFILLGIYLVNRLAHHMSKAEAHSRRQAHELDQLEKLAQGIIEAPPDGSTLPELLEAALPNLFPTDKVSIHLFEPPEKEAWKAFDLNHPSAGPVAATGEDWEKLRQSQDSNLLLPKVTLPGRRRTFGDALLSKIIVEETGQGDKAFNLAGGVYFLRHKSAGDSIESLASVESLASQIGTALTRANTHAELLAFHKAQQELEFAGRIQASFLPTGMPQADNWQISAELVSARQTSGDFYDFIPLENGLIGLVVADVSDKGTGAALYMALSRTLLRTYAMESGLHPEVALARANDRIRQDAASDQFVTLIYGVLDPVTGLLTYANAGHNPGYLLRAESGQVDKLIRTGIPLGMFEGMAWERAQIQIQPGDLLLLYTDGVPEAQNLAYEEFGDDRFIALGQEKQGRPAAEIQDTVIAAIDEFAGDAPQFDDITLMVITREA